MNYRPDSSKIVLWDTWMYPDPNGLRMHLFFLASKPGSQWEQVGHTTSEDLVHWQPLPLIPVRHPVADYEVGIVGTGMVFESGDGGFMMSYTANLEGPQQRIGFLHSKDLIHWEKRWSTPCFGAEGPDYETDVRNSPCKSAPAFRDAFVHRVNGRFEALIGAQSTRGDPLSRAVIARYRAADAELRNWEPLPPLLGPDVTMLMEVPEHFQIGDKHYLIWSTSSGIGLLCETPSRRRCIGTFYAIGNAYDGPYSCPSDNLLIGAGDTDCVHCYVGRTVMWGGERLLYHHHGSPWPSLGLPKRILQQPDGSLKLGYWPGIEKIHRRQLRPLLRTIEVQGENLKAGQWQVIGEDGLLGTIGRGASLGLIQTPLPPDLHLRCRVTFESGDRFGISLRDGGWGNKGPKGVALQADTRHGEWQFGAPVHCWCSRIDPLETIYDRPLCGKCYQLDLLVRDIYFEAYVNGILLFSRVIRQHAEKGGMGFFVDNGTVRFDQIRLWEIEPMSHPFSSINDPLK